MRRKLLLLDLALVLLTAAAGWQLRQEWLAARAREQAMMNQKVKPAPVPPLAPLPPTPPVVPAGYAEIAQKMLFARDRNPNVVVETKAPPPPKPMPQPPVLRGVMNLGDGPVAIMALRGGGLQKEYRKGDMVGDFKLLAVWAQQVVLEWEGKTVTRTVEKIAPVEQEAAPSQRTAGPAPGPAAAPVVKQALGPGSDIAAGTRACQPNDSTAPGTVVDGYKKVVVPSPFGPSCRWDAVK